MCTVDAALLDDSLQEDWNLTRFRRAHRSVCIRWGSNPRLRRDWGLNPTPSWLIVDERPTRPRIQMCRKYFVRDSDRVRTRIDLVRIDPATLAGVDFKSTALTTRPHYLAQIHSAVDRHGSRTRSLQISSPSRLWGVAAAAWRWSHPRRRPDAPWWCVAATA